MLPGRSSLLGALRDAPPHGVEIGGRRLPLQYVPREAAELALADAARAWASAAQGGPR